MNHQSLSQVTERLVVSMAGSLYINKVCVILEAPVKHFLSFIFVTCLSTCDIASNSFESTPSMKDISAKKIISNELESIRTKTY